MRFSILFSIILFTCPLVCVFGQNQKKLDSLFNQLKIAESKPSTYTNDTTKVNIFANISWEYKNNEPEKAYEFCMQGLGLAQKIKYKKGEALCYNVVGLLNSYKGKYSDAIEYQNMTLKIYKGLSASKDSLERNDGVIGEASCYSNIAVACKEQAKYPEAIDFLQKSLDIYEKHIKSDSKRLVKKCRIGIASCYNNMGNVYKLQGNYTKGLELLQKSLKAYEEQSDKKGTAGCLNNIGEIHRLQGNYSNAIDYYNRSLAVWEEVSHKKGIAVSNNNIGLVYQQQKEFKKAILSFQKSLETMKILGDQKGIASGFNNLGMSFNGLHDYKKATECYNEAIALYAKIGDNNGVAMVYVNMAELSFDKKDYSSVIKYGKLSYSLSLETGSLLVQKNACQLIAQALDSKGNQLEAYKYFKLYSVAKDSLFNQEKSKQLAQMEAIYQSEKKQKEIELLNKENEKQAALAAAESRRQQIIIYAVIGFLILVMAFAVFAYRSYLQKRKANILLAGQKIEIQEKNEELKKQNEEIEAQRDTLNVQNNVLSEQKKEITDSINYAKRIQQAILPEMNSVTENVQAGQIASPLIQGTCNNTTGFEAFVLFRPKDIVSGDFYWSTYIHEYLIVTVADCTGHGVPGAFMSMLGISFLNEIVRKKEIITPSEILNQLRISIIEALQQKGQTGEQKDGMDMALVTINTNNLEMQFAGANNPVYIVKRPSCLQVDEKPNVKSDELLNVHLIELKGDQMPVAIFENLKPFTNNEYKLCKGDCVYLASDGFEDQFGGPKNKKFMARQLKDLFVKIANKPMPEQGLVLEKTFEDWRLRYEQIDDVTILGLSI